MSHLIFTFSITSLCDQGNAHVKKETKVKLLGVKDLKEKGVEASLVSTDKFDNVTCYSISHLTLTLSIISLCCQGTGSVEKETEVKLLGVKDSKDNGVKARVLTSLISLLFTPSVISR